MNPIATTSNPISPNATTRNSELVWVVPNTNAWTGRAQTLTRGFHALALLDSSPLHTLNRLHFDTTTLGSLFLQRGCAETNSRFLQLIPYVLLRQGSRGFLCFRRNRKGGESRLHGKRFLGIGGHLNPSDASVEAGIERELTEEVDIRDGSGNRIDGSGARFRGVLMDNSDSVGSVHLGLLYILDLPEDAVVTPTDSAGFTLEAVIDFHANPAVFGTALDYEGWSRLLLESIDLLSPVPLEDPNTAVFRRAAGVY